MATAVDYVNRALDLIGARPISVLSPEDSPNAATASRLYEPALDEMLSEWPWRFATTRVQLSQVAEGLPGGSDWTYQYAIPLDCLRIVRTDTPQARFEIYAAPGEVAGGGMQKRLYTDEPVVWADVVRRIDSSLLPAHFTRAFVMRLAALLAMPVTRRFDIADAFEARAVAALAEAKAQDWNEMPWPELDDSRLLADARYGY